MAGLQHALENVRRNAVHDPDFKSLPSPTGKQPALEHVHDHKVMEQADKTLVDLSAEGKLAQPLTPNTGPPLLPADHPIEDTDRGPGGDRNILDAWRCSDFGVWNSSAQPAGQHHRRGIHGGTEHRVPVARRGFGAQNHRQ